MIGLGRAHVLPMDRDEAERLMVPRAGRRFKP